MPSFKVFCNTADLIDEASKLGGIYRTFDRKRYKRPVFLCLQRLVWGVIEISGKEEELSLLANRQLCFLQYRSG